MLAGRGEAASQAARLRSSEKINKILNMSDTDDEELDKEAVGKKVGLIVLIPPALLHCPLAVFRLPRSCRRRYCRSTRISSPTSTGTEVAPLERRSSIRS